MARGLRAIGLFLQRCFDGVANGAIYASLALALVIVNRSTGLLNPAQGEMATMSTYIAMVLHTPVTPALAGTGLAATFIPFSPWPTWLSVLGAMAFGAALSAGVERVVLRRLTDESGFGVVSGGVGVMLVINGWVERTWRNVLRGFEPIFPNRPDDFFHIGPSRLRYVTVGTWATILLVLVLLFILLRFTTVGLAFRAVSSNREGSALVGIRAGRIVSLGWALAGAIGALAGCLVAPTVLLEPGMMVRVLIFAMVAATLGGLDSLAGALIGGLFVGLSQTMLGGYVRFIGSALSLPGALLMMVFVLLYRPTGLLGTKKVERV